MLTIAGVVAFAAVASVAVLGSWHACPTEEDRGNEQPQLALIRERMNALAAVDCLGDAASSGAALSSNEVFAYRVAVRSAERLFGSEITASLEEMGRRAGRLAAVSAQLEGMEPGDQRSALVGEQMRLAGWLADEAGTLRSRLAASVSFRSRT